MGLTYDDEHLPENGSLRKKDAQDFFKRLRTELSEQGRRIRTYYVGEYGETYFRPHYHAVIFGMDIYDHDRQLLVDKWPLSAEHQIQPTPFTFGRGHYVAKYIQKQLLRPGEWRKTYPDLERPFGIASQGIGLRWARENEARIFQDGGIKYQGKVYPIPRYYMSKIAFPDSRKILDRFARERFEENEDKYRKALDRHWYKGDEPLDTLIHFDDGIRRQRNLNAKAREKLGEDMRKAKQSPRAED